MSHCQFDAFYWWAKHIILAYLGLSGRISYCHGEVSVRQLLTMKADRHFRKHISGNETWEFESFGGLRAA